MQSKLFVFIGLQDKESDANLEVLKDRLESKFKENNLPLTFNRKEELLSGRLEDVSFYISFFKSKDELKYWYQMARDFELKLEKKPVNREDLLKRYNVLEKSISNLYQKNHFTTALLIMDEMEKFEDIVIYSFQ